MTLLDPHRRDRIAAQDIAGYIIDALIDAEIIQKSDFDRALKISQVEIEVRIAASRGCGFETLELEPGGDITKE